jgi:hypothetical protein
LGTKWHARQLRETLSAVIVLEILLEGVHFDSASIWGMPFDHNSVARTFRALIDAGVIARSPVKGKYRLTDEFLDTMKLDIIKGMPRGILVHYPDLKVFDVSGIEEWTEEELDRYIARLRERWQIRRGQAQAR